MIRIVLKDEIQSRRKKLMAIQEKGDKATKDQKIELQRGASLLRLKMYREVQSHEVSAYTGKTGAYKIAPAEAGDEQREMIVAITREVAREEAREVALDVLAEALGEKPKDVDNKETPTSK